MTLYTDISPECCAVLALMAAAWRAWCTANIDRLVPDWARVRVVVP